MMTRRVGGSPVDRHFVSSPGVCARKHRSTSHIFCGGDPSMKSVAKVVLSLLLAIMIALPLMAQDQPKKPKRAPKKPDQAAGILKRLEKAELTDEQVAKIKELAAKLPDPTAKLTDEQKKKLAEAMKQAKAEGKSMKDIQQLRESVLDLTEEQKAAMKEAQAAREAGMKEIMALLTPEQREKAGVKVRAKKEGGKKKGGAKKPRAEE
jgi:Spy/CpxP family protein refolding chaperone